MDFEGIVWPRMEQIIDDAVFVRDPLFRNIKNLCLRTGTCFSILYFVLIAVVRPLLHRQYEQRIELNLLTVIKLRKLIPHLLRKLKKTYVSDIDINPDAKFVSRYVQTIQSGTCGDDTDATNDGTELWVEDNWNLANMKLKHINYSLQQCKNTLEPIDDTIEAINFQLKLFNDQCKSYERNSRTSNSPTSEICDNIRQMKGWFINGEVS